MDEQHAPERETDALLLMGSNREPRVAGVNRVATLARATVIADRYGQGTYGTIAGVAASIPIAARALAPVAAALYAAAVGYSILLWTLAMLALAASALAYRAELNRPAMAAYSHSEH